MRNYTRTGGKGQVTPDGMIARRGGAPCSVEIPVSRARQEGKEIFTIFETKETRSVFSELEMTLEPVSVETKAPRLYWNKKIFTVSGDGKDSPPSGYSGTSLFTETSKMSCPSFSVPAGPTYEFGTCPAANYGKDGGLREAGKDFICDSCYAFGGNYLYPNVAISQAARQEWAKRLVESDPTGMAFAQSMEAAIRGFATEGTMGTSMGGVGSRLVLELGVQQNGRLMVPVELPEIDGIRWMQSQTSLPSFTGFSNTDEWRRARGVPDGEICGFFRIHDSGDFGLGKSLPQWKTYVAGWIEVANLLPWVEFWAPTRMWKWKTLFPAKIPRNLHIRASALSVNDPAPSSRLGAGSTVFSDEMADLTLDAWAGTRGEGGETWQCPVYSRGKGMKKSCMGAGCRACWIGEAPVSYRLH